MFGTEKIRLLKDFKIYQWRTVAGAGTRVCTWVLLINSKTAICGCLPYVGVQLYSDIILLKPNNIATL